MPMMMPGCSVLTSCRRLIGGLKTQGLHALLPADGLQNSGSMTPINWVGHLSGLRVSEVERHAQPQCCSFPNAASLKYISPALPIFVHANNSSWHRLDLPFIPFSLKLTVL